MAATNYTPIQLYHSTTASAVPVNTNLVNGELAINITDGKLYYKDNGGTVQVIASKGTGTIGGSTTQVQYNLSGALAGSSNFVFDGTTATINTLNLTNALGATYGGTAQSSWTTGDLLYASGSNTLAKLGIGLNTYILTSNGSIPGWAAPSAISVNTATNLAGGAAGSVPYQSGAGATTFLSIGTANQVVTSTGSAPQWSSGLSITTLTASNAVTFSATTQNIALGTSQTSGTFTVGGAAQTGNIVVDQSTKTHTLNIGTGITESGQTKTINIGTAGDTGSTTAITIGSANGTTITVNGTVNANGGVTIGDASGDAFTINSSAVSTPNGLNFDSNTFVIDAANNRVGIGEANPSYKLDIKGGNGNQLKLNNAGEQYTQIDFNNNGTLKSSLWYDNSTNGFAVYSATALRLFTGGDSGSAKAIIDSSGNLGLGVTPSPWDPIFRVQQIGLGAFVSGRTDTNSQVQVGCNAYYDDVDNRWEYISSGFASRYYQDNSVHVWETAPSWNGTGSNAITFTQAMTLTATGNWQLGTTTAYNANGFGRHANIRGTSNAVLYIGNDSAEANCMQLGWTATESYVGNLTSIPLTFLVNNVEKARIDTSGTLILRQSSNAANTSVSFNTTVQNALTLDSSGNLGVGTPTPDSNSRVHAYKASGNSYIRVESPNDVNTAFWSINSQRSWLAGMLGGTSGFYQIYDLTAAASRVTVDTSGNVGLGVTPSTWASNFVAMQIGPGATVNSASDGRAAITSNIFIASGPTAKYIANGFGAAYTQLNGAHLWFTAPNNTSGPNIDASGGSTTMTLDASGNLAIGTTSIFPNPRLSVYNGATLTTGGDGGGNGVLIAAATGAASSGQLVVAGSDTAAIDKGGAIVFAGKWDTATNNIAQWAKIVGYKENATNNNYAGYLGFYTRADGGSATERARITSGGDFRVKGAGTAGSTDAFQISGSAPADAARLTSGGDFLIGKTASNINVVGVENLSNGAIFSTCSGSTNATSSYNLYSTGASAYRFYVDMAGTIFATSTTISAISDQRFKENIRDLDVGLDAILALKPRKFDWKAGKGKDKKDDRGFIAQEFEQVFPDLIDTWKDPAPEGEEPYKSVRQDLIPVLVKAIQEQQAMIKQLEAKVASLEAK